MKKFGLIVAVCLMSLVSVSCVAMDMVGGTSGSWRYKVTVVVETTEGIKTGSAVREMTAQSKKNILPAEAAILAASGGVAPEIQAEINRGGVGLNAGEAVAIDLGQRGVLFALLGSNENEFFFKAFPFEKAATTPEGIEYYTHLKNAKAILPPSQYPQFVHFKDINDPKTVEGVQDVISCPSEQKECVGRTGYVALDTMGKGFGVGVKLKEVSIEMTDEPVTYGVSKYLSWLPEYYNKMFDGQRYNTIKSDYPLANSMASGSFSTGVK